MNRQPILLFVLFALLPAACSDRASDNPDLVARAGDLELTVQEGAQLIAPITALPNRTDVAMAVANLWVDYALLATAVAEDSTLGQIDVEPLVRQQAEQTMIMALRDSVIHVDTSFDPAELRRRYRDEAPRSEIRARHILRTLPADPTDSQVDSVRSFVQELRRRIVDDGEDFAALAQRYSQDPATAGQGGEIGFFGPGDMLAEFRTAAEALGTGEISEPVRTPFGFHLIQVEGRRTPSIEEFRSTLARQRVAHAESAYVAGLIEAADGEYADGAFDAVRSLARNPTGLGRNEENRPLITFRGGQLTIGEVGEFLESRPPQYRAQVAGASDALIREQLFRPLYERELLVSEARAQGWDVDAGSLQDVRAAARASIRSVARELGLVEIQPNAGQSRNQAIETATAALVASIIRNDRDAVPLGAIGVLLRDHYGARINPDGVTRLVARVADTRAGPDDGP